MLRLFIDHDFNYKILRGLKRRIPQMDFVTAQELGVEAGQDTEHLIRALKDRRVVLTHDVNTFTDAANQRLKNGEEIFGLIVVPQAMPIGQAIGELEIIVLCSEEDEYENQILYLPLRLV